MTNESFFEELRAAREAHGTTLQDIARQTSIDIRFLEALERGDTSILPDAYVRAFLRHYASAVGLDPVLVMQKFDTLHPGSTQRKGTVAKSVSAREPAPEQQTSDNTPWWSRPTVRGIGTTIAILAGIVLIAVIAQQRDATPPQEIPFSEMVKENEKRFTPPDTVAGSVVPLPPGRTDSLTLRASATDSVWLQIAVDALPPTDYLFPPNAQRSWRARDRFTVTLGNAGGVRFRLNNRDLGALGKRGAVLRNVELTRETLTSPVRIESTE